MPAPQAAEFRDFLYHAQHADEELGRLLRALQARGRPAVVLFFGDHLPGLGKAYDSLRFADGKPARQQPVPFVLWRSDRPGARVRANDAMQSWMLPSQLLSLAGLGDDPYFALAGEVAQRLDGAPRAERGRLLRGINAAAVARLNGSFASRLQAHRQAAKEKAR